MLKWFRLYNKWILAVGGSLLMVAFLITGPMLDLFRPDPTREVIGHLGEREIRRLDQNQAASQLAILGYVNPLLDQMAPQEALTWLLMLEEAQQMGVSASIYEAKEIAAILGLSDADLKRIARDHGFTFEDLVEALRAWCTVQTYKELLLGSEHEAVGLRLNELNNLVSQFQQIGQQQPFMRQYYLAMLYQQMERLSLGKPRASEPLLERFVSDQQANVKIGVAPVPADFYLDKVADPTEQQIKDLYEQYQDQLPGQSKPYGFGYRFPRRLKLEYLAIPFDQVKATIRINESDAIAQYTRTKAQYEIAPTPPAAKPEGDAAAPATPAEKQYRPYDEVRSQIIDQLRTEKAQELAERMIKTAQAMLVENARHLEQTAEGYRTVTDSFVPRPLEEIAAQLQEQFKVQPTVARHENGWLTGDLLATLPGIGSSSIAGKRNFAFVDYMLSCRELEPADDNPLATLRLQAKLPSLPLQSFDDSRYLVRVLAAEPERAPLSLDEVRHAVAQDARRLAAYQYAKGQMEYWTNRLKQDSLLVLSQEVKSNLSQPAAFPRREVTFGRIEVPQVDPVGQNAQFVDAVFDLAEVIAAQGTGTLEGISPDKRSGVVAVDAKLSLYLVRVDAFNAIKESDYRRVAGFPQVASWLQQALLSELEQDPFSLEALSTRLGYRSVSEPQAEPAQNAG